MISSAEDPDVDILNKNGLVNVYVDLRGKEINTKRLLVRADNSHVYIYDPDSNSIVKIIYVNELIDPSTLSVSEKNGIINISLKKT
jgi:HSP20 family molecular chaperone IbpA